jgi:predicted dinucleotide-binding enzyme
MIVGILGAGRIGSTIAGRLSADGHEVRLANSRGPDTIRDVAAAAHASATTAADAVAGADVVITSIPFPRIPLLRAVMDAAPTHAVIIDTSNYFPFKDGVIAAVNAGQVESEWVAEQFGRDIVKAWNNILAGSFASKAMVAGAAGRIALAVAGDDSRAKSMAMDLVDATGFDPVDSGPIADSWRQQPGTPAYCTELSADDLRRGLLRADRSSSAAKRDLMVERMLAIEGTPTNEDLLRLSRETYL